MSQDASEKTIQSKSPQIKPVPQQEDKLLCEFELFKELLAVLKQQDRPEAQVQLVQKAFDYAREKHDGQLRKEGSNYITHPVEVATILAQVPVDTPTVCAALLHDVLEDTTATPDEVKTLFGAEILKIVEGVTKLSKYQFESRQERNAENFRKMFLAMADDVRIILLKLCDRLHNMRTLDYMKPEKQQQIARETLEVFAPLANRMGMGRWRSELEDLSFRYLYPDEYKSMSDRIEHEKADWENVINEMMKTLKDHLKTEQGIDARLYGRVKNYYSLYSKMQKSQKTLQDIYDLTALRILVSTEKECYEALGVIHSIYKPIPGRFKDYIAIAKSNLYQSLHTTVLGPNMRPIEVQIRTDEMHRVAEYGVAAHWRYKEAGSVNASRTEDMKMSWLKQMLEMKEHAEDAQDYVESIKLDLFRDEVFVFTPAGDVIDLPIGSTPVDFAFRIHTQVGCSCTGAMVNGKIVPLDYHLTNGDVIEIITTKKATPKLDWIKFVQTHQAKTRIRQWFKKNHREDHVEQGQKLLEAELTRNGYDEIVKSGKLLKIAQELNYPELEDMLLALGYGELSLVKIQNRIEKEKKAEAPAATTEILEQLAKNPFQKRRSNKRDEIIGLEGMLYHLAKCCSPLPGDDIVGVITRSRGVMVHRTDCSNMLQVNPERILPIEWNYEVAKSPSQMSSGNSSKQSLHNVRLEVMVIDRIGVFKDVLARVADTNTNLTNARVKVVENNTAIIELAVDVTHIEHLDKVVRGISKLPDVISVRRSQFRAQK